VPAKFTGENAARFAERLWKATPPQGQYETTDAYRRRVRLADSGSVHLLPLMPSASTGRYSVDEGVLRWGLSQQAENVMVPGTLV
jgi:hypothetical protein